MTFVPVFRHLCHDLSFMSCFVPDPLRHRRLHPTSPTRQSLTSETSRVGQATKRKSARTKQIKLEQPTISLAVVAVWLYFVKYFFSIAERINKNETRPLLPITFLPTSNNSVEITMTSKGFPRPLSGASIATLFLRRAGATVTGALRDPGGTASKRRTGRDVA